MNQIRQEEAFRKEKNSILIQFFLFNIAFLSRAVFFAYELYRIYYGSETEDSSQAYDTALVQQLFYIPWNVLPVSFIYYTHYRTFSSMAPETDDNLKSQTKTAQTDTVVMLAADTSPQHRLSNSVNHESIDIEAKEDIEECMLMDGQENVATRHYTQKIKKTADKTSDGHSSLVKTITEQTDTHPSTLPAKKHLSMRITA